MGGCDAGSAVLFRLEIARPSAAKAAMKMRFLRHGRSRALPKTDLN